MIPEWTAKYVGLPFAEKGRGPGAFDCWGLVREVLAAEFGISYLPDYTACYTHTADKTSVSEAVNHGLAVGWFRVPYAEPGALLVLRIGGQPRHVAVAVNSKWMLHVLEGSNSVLERLDSMTWSGRIAGIYVRG